MAKMPVRKDLFNLLRSKKVAIKHSNEFKESVALCLEEILDVKLDNLSPKEHTGYSLSNALFHRLSQNVTKNIYLEFTHAYIPLNYFDSCRKCKNERGQKNSAFQGRARFLSQTCFIQVKYQTNILSHFWLLVPGSSHIW